MDFFDRQEKAHRRTRWLVAYFLISIVVMIAAIYVVIVGIFVVGMNSQNQGAEASPEQWWIPELFLGVAVTVTAIVLLGSLYKTLQLRSGGDVVAISLGGRRIQPNSTELGERRLMNVVEEMALASGVPVPATYVLDDEPGINAFAAGWSTDQAVVAVNRGTLDYLTRDELQGVIAHEFSHILNGDMRLNIRLIGLLHGIFIVSLIGYFLLRSTSSRRRSKGRGQIVLLGLAIYLIGLLGVVFGRIIQASVSREREYLADASAVQFTRNPRGIAGALKKIGGLVYGSRVAAPQAEGAAHMFFGNAVSRLKSGLFATHPPLDKRIKAIDPDFDGQFPEVKPRQQPLPADAPADSGPSRPTTMRIPGVDQAIPVDPIVILGAAGEPSEEHLQYSRETIQEIPPALLEAARQPFEAQGVALSLLLDDDPAIRRRQLEAVRRRLGDGAVRSLERLQPLHEQLSPHMILPLVEVAQGTLRELTPDQFAAFRDAMRDVIEADDKLTILEFVLFELLVEKLGRNYTRQNRAPIRYHRLREIRDQVGLLLSVLAHTGHEDPATVAYAFRRATALLGEDPVPVLRAESEIDPRQLGPALRDIRHASPPLKKRILRAALECAAADGTLRPEEAQLLRAISDSIDVPLPPILPVSTPPSQKETAGRE